MAAGKRVVIVSGTPGTGKTVVAKKLASELNLDYIDVKSVIKEYGLAEEYDEKRKCDVVDADKLCRALIKMINSSEKGVVIDSHMSHYLKPESVDLCIITKCGLKTLQKRLAARGYDKDKVRENLDAEILDLCYNEAVEAGHKVVVVDTDASPDLSGIIKKMKH